MSCQMFPLIHLRIRVARSAAQAGQCAIARRWLRRAARGVAAVKADHRAMANPCSRALAKGAGEMLAAGHRELQERCGHS
jgi:phytoene/squalene synthetase